MSEENVEIALKVIDALNQRDEEAFVGCLDPDVQWEENTPIYPGLRRVYRGTAEARAWFNEVVLEFWDAFHFESEETTEGPGDRVLLGGLITARGKGSGVETELHVWGVVWIANGAITRRRIFLDRDEVLEAAGLRE